MYPRLTTFVLLAGVAAMAQKPETLLDRLRNAPLPAEQRDEVVRSFEAKDYARAEATLDRNASAAATAHVAGVAYALAAGVAFLEGHMDRAAVSFRQADVRASLDDPDRFTFAMTLVNLGNAQAAREQLMRLTVAHPDNPLYLYWLARIDYDQRLYEPAVEKLRRVIRLSPSFARAYDNLGLALDMLGQSDDAREAFNTAVDLNRKQPQPSGWPPHNLGALLLRLQQMPQAEAALRESLRYDPQFNMAHYHLGRVLEATGRDNEAIEEYRAAVAGSSPVTEAYYSLGLLYRRHDREAEAQSAFAEYKKLKAQSPP